MSSREVLSQIRIARHKRKAESHAVWYAIEKAWNDSRIVARALCLTGISLALWTGFIPQSPGVSIGLLALVAGIMSVRPKMHPAEKFAWVGILIAFAILEVHAIRVSDARNLNDQSVLNAQFKSITKQQKSDFDATAKGLETVIQKSQIQFQATVKGLDANLAIEQSVRRQTLPSALFVTGLMDFNFGTSLQVPNRKFTLHIPYSNEGTDSATRINYLARVYAAPADEDDAKVDISSKFNKAWYELVNSGRPEDSPGKVLVRGTNVSRDYLQDGFTAEEIGKMQSREYTIYVLYRVRYTDTTGTWVNDECRRFYEVPADLPDALFRSRSCRFFNHPHYRATQP
jgi:hypothetical protein